MGGNMTKNQIDVHIGHRVRLARLEADISQDTLGKKLGLTFQQVQKYEKGTNRIGGSRMVEIARALGKSPGWFFEGAPGGEGKKSDGVDVASEFMASDRSAVDLARCYLELDAKRRGILLETARQFCVGSRRAA
jgi:transcriptional regulator with XRE-family HTH domain